MIDHPAFTAAEARALRLPGIAAHLDAKVRGVVVLMGGGELELLRQLGALPVSGRRERAMLHHALVGTDMRSDAQKVASDAARRVRIAARRAAAPAHREAA